MNQNLLVNIKATKENIEIIKFDLEAHSRIICPKSGIHIDFQDEDIASYIDDTFVLGVFLSIQHEECALGGVLNEAWKNFYEKYGDDLDLEELIVKFPGPYKAIEVNLYGMACGAIHDVAYYVIPDDCDVLVL